MVNYKIKQILCRHDWIKFGGPTRVGNGKFRQVYKCLKCNKVKTNNNY